MPRLAKNYYRTKEGHKRINCYMANIPKEIVKKAGLEDDDEIAIREEYGTIVILKKWHCTCMECGIEWESGELPSITSSCPSCHCGDIRFEDNGEVEW